MKAALYTRVSTRDKGQETANQLNHLREFCAAQGWPIVNEYEDHESGGKADCTLPPGSSHVCRRSTQWRCERYGVSRG
jgi:hypothetical protein